MKKFINITGLFGIMVVFIGGLFKLLHWPGAGIMLVVGLLTFGLIFIPFALFNNYRKGNGKKYPFLYLSAFLSVSLNCVLTLFIIMQWPGPQELFLLAMFLPFVLFVPALIFHYVKHKVVSLNQLIIILFFLAYTAIADVFLSLSVQREVLNEAVQFEQYFSEELEWLTMSNEKLYQQVGMTDDMAIPAREQTNELMALVDTIRYQLLLESNDEFAIMAFQKGEFELHCLNNKENKHVGTSVMLSQEKAHELSARLEAYKALLNEGLKSGDEIDFDKLISTADYVEDGKTYDWEQVSFGGKHLVWTFNSLTRIACQVKQAEQLYLQSHVLP